MSFEDKVIDLADELKEVHKGDWQSTIEDFFDENEVESYNYAIDLVFESTRYKVYSVAISCIDDTDLILVTIAITQELYLNTEGQHMETLAWQFTKNNFKEGAPEFIRNNKNITLFSSYGGKRIGGEIQTSEGITRIFENDIIMQHSDGTIDIYKYQPGVFL